MNSNEIKAGSKVVMTHSQRQAFLKKSSLGKLLGVAHLLPEVKEETNTKYTLVTTEPVFFSLVRRKGRKSYRQSVRSSRHIHSDVKYIVKALPRG